jgi:hypothetical protein
MKISSVIVVFTFLALAGCDQQSQGFNLPAGNAEQGKANFILMQCNNCHSIEGSVPWSGEDSGQSINVVLGGPTTQVKTYGDLVTSIIHPSHKLSRGEQPGTVTPDGESTMRNYNDVMSVQELIDLVEFLQSEYEIWVPDYYTYRR